MALFDTDTLLTTHRTLEQLATFLRVHPVSVRRWRGRREGPPAVKVAGRLYFPRDLTDEWLRAQLQAEQRNG